MGGNNGAYSNQPLALTVRCDVEARALLADVSLQGAAPHGIEMLAVLSLVDHEITALELDRLERVLQVAVRTGRDWELRRGGGAVGR